MRTLVLGATGQVGTAVVKKLLASGAPVRAVVRSEQSAARMRSLGAEPVMADLTNPTSLDSACEQVSVVISTANAAIPTRAGDSFEAVERHGYRNLIRAAQQTGVSRFVYTSVVRSRYENSIPFFRYKRETETLLNSGKLDCVIFRAGIFMDVSFAMMGSMIPVRGAEAATIQRPFPFVANHLKRIKDSIEKKGVAMIPGDGTTRHSFICIDDVSNLLCAAATSRITGTFDAGGPEALSYLDIVRLYESILGTTLQVKKTPGWLFAAIASLMGPFSPAASNLMRLNHLAAIEDSVLPAAEKTAATFGVSLTTADSFLRARSSAPAD